MVNSDNTPFHLIYTNIEITADCDINQLIQFTINEYNADGINNQVSVIDILYDSQNNIYVADNNTIYRVSDNECNIHTIMTALYPGKQFDITITWSSVGINVCCDMVSDRKTIHEFIDTLDGGVCQGDIQLH